MEMKLMKKSIEPYSSTKSILRERGTLNTPPHMWHYCQNMCIVSKWQWEGRLKKPIVDSKMRLFYPLDMGEFPPQLTPTEVMR
jgi:hypothetical protein